MKTILIILLIPSLLTGCFHLKCVAVFDYTVETRPLKQNQPVSIRTADGSVKTLDPVVIDLITAILNASGAVEAAKIISIATVGDPAAIVAWQGQVYVKSERKSLLKFEFYDTNKKEKTDE